MAAAAAHAPPADLRDLAGARAAGAEAQLLARGYALVRVETMRGGKVSRWWNGKRRQCVAVTTVNGRYRTIATAAPGACGHGLKPIVGGRERDRIRPEVDNTR